MSQALLTIGRSPKAVSFSFGNEGMIALAPLPSPALVESIVHTAAENFGGAQVRPAIVAGVEHLLPPKLMDRLSRWASVESEERTLCVRCDDSLLGTLPWEALLRSRFAEVVDLFVARVTHGKAKAPPSATESNEMRMVMAGWARLEGIVMPGIERELREVQKRLKNGGVDFQALGSPTSIQLQSACEEHEPVIVHLSSPGVSDWWGKAEMAMSARSRGKSAKGASAQIEMVPAAHAAKILSTSSRLALVVLNTCHSGLGASRDLASKCAATCVGWPGWVDDNIAADFALYFYQRLLEGYSVVGAARSFATLGRQGSSVGPGAVPCVWLPSTEWVAWRPILAKGADLVEGAMPLQGRASRASRKPRRTTSGAAVADKSLPAPSSGNDLRQQLESSEFTLAASNLPGQAVTVETEFKLREAINPALLLNGRGPIHHLSFDSDRDVPLVRLEIHCDAGGCSSTHAQTIHLRKGVTPCTNLDEIVFPALFDLASRSIPRRMVNFTVRLVQGFGAFGEVLAEETRAAQWMARNEWLDRKDLWAFIPAFVQPTSRGVRMVLDDADKMLRYISGPGAAFDGYQGDNPHHVRSQVRAIFQTLRDDPYAMSYVNPLSSPVYEVRGRSPGGQLVRFPDELIEHRRGTCHDLSLMFASCLEHVGLHPVIILIGGHTFAGFWLSAKEHTKYWRQARSELGRSDQDARYGVITDLGKLQTCLGLNGRDPKIEVFECTDATNRTGTFESAVKKAAARAKELKTEKFQAAIDVFAARSLVQPL